MQYLGDTLPKIAAEKAGIIKADTPVVISQSQEECESVFRKLATAKNAPLVFADDHWKVQKKIKDQAKNDNLLSVSYEVVHDLEKSELEFGLLGDYQVFNLPGILESIEQLRQMGWELSDMAVRTGLLKVSQLTGLKGRWQILGKNPWIITDTGHNEPEIKAILDQLKTYQFDQLWIVLGMVSDKDISKALSLMPKNAHYIFCEATIPRAMPAKELAEKASIQGLKGEIIPSIPEAVRFARKKAQANDLIFIGGSTFVVAEIEEL